MFVQKSYYKLIINQLGKKRYAKLRICAISVAGTTGFEPVLTVLETAVLPLTPCPY